MQIVDSPKHFQKNILIEISVIDRFPRRNAINNSLLGLETSVSIEAQPISYKPFPRPPVLYGSLT